MSPAQVYAYDLSALQWKAKGRSPISGSGGSGGGGSFTSPPTLADVGRPAGSPAMTSHAGGYVSTSNLVLEDREITASGDTTFVGTNVTLRRCRIVNHLILGGSTILLEDCEVGSIAFSGAHDVQCYRTKITGTIGKDALHVTANPTNASGRSTNVLIDTVHAVTDYATVMASGNHYDSIQCRGVVGLTVRNFLFDQGDRPASIFNGTIFVESANGGNESILFEDGWVRGGGYNSLQLFNATTLRRLHIAPDYYTSAGGSPPYPGSGEHWNKPIKSDSIVPTTEDLTWWDADGLGLKIEGTPIPDLMAA